ncbi:uncharacterized protein PHALS_10147 [Plasmopara halstedii]|uniref:Uncharacterized protein n=1 Tax=Plasmopara halstedii TaxID=4781 RepID=A0A0P1AFN9_PLAHL|nr:uncharacterized protein PHALS_10147 [Plasmopara halstedii]CEG39921.1 hypothetical protein PHALS_10147 [Plasmopara halstedii]|eukprot:XP_024576290.1 hypothetical protein PHALS_10147 [Plasmopara halstedii]
MRQRYYIEVPSLTWGELTNVMHCRSFSHMIALSDQFVVFPSAPREGVAEGF